MRLVAPESIIYEVEYDFFESIEVEFKESFE